MGYTFGVGREAPVFTLTDTSGSDVSLRDYRGDWSPVLVFFDVADPQAGARLAALSLAADRLWGMRGQLLGISPSAPSELTALAAAVPGLSFPLLADTDAAVCRAYGVGDSRTGVPGRWVACIVDRAGKIVWMGEGDEAVQPPSLLFAFETAVR